MYGRYFMKLTLDEILTLRKSLPEYQTDFRWNDDDEVDTWITQIHEKMVSLGLMRSWEESNPPEDEYETTVYYETTELGRAAIEEWEKNVQLSLSTVRS